MIMSHKHDMQPTKFNASSSRALTFDHTKCTFEAFVEAGDRQWGVV